MKYLIIHSFIYLNIPLYPLYSTVSNALYPTVSRQVQDNLKPNYFTHGIKSKTN
jgi:hypothetical protein